MTSFVSYDRGDRRIDKSEIQRSGNVITQPPHVCHLIATFLLTIAFSSTAAAQQQTATPSPAALVRGDQVVAADHLIASEVGTKIMREGGNAVDAGVATLLALGVVNPFASGIGGGGFCLYNQGDGGETVVLDFREVAPAAATADMYIENGKARIDKTIHGGLAIGVPGELAGLESLHKRYGKLKWAQVVKPARVLADKGFTVGELLPKRLKASEKRLGAELSSLFKQGDGWVKAGDTLKRPNLGKTLRAVEQNGAKAFYTGEIASAIADTAKKSGGILTEDDLTNYAPVWRKPVIGHYRGYRIDTMPPPSSGGTTLLTTLNILSRYDLNTLGYSTETLHYVAEALKHAFADRARWLGDADFVDVPTERLVSKAYAAKKVVDPSGVLSQQQYGSHAPSPDDAGTSHMSASDGVSVLSCTSTINTSFGSKVLVPEYGIILNNEMGDFTAQPGVPNNYGLMGNEQNAIAPGKRPLSSMTPTIVFDSTGKPIIGVGGSGGPTIITGTLWAIIRHIDFGQNVAESVGLPRTHHQWLPNKLFAEALPESWVNVLKKRGQNVVVRRGGNAIQMIAKEKSGWTAASDPRKNGKAAANK